MKPGWTMALVSLLALAGCGGGGIGTRVCLEPELWPPERQRALLVRLLGPLFDSLNTGGSHARAHAPAA